MNYTPLARAFVRGLIKRTEGTPFEPLRLHILAQWIIPVAIILPDLIDCIYQNILGVVAKPEQINNDRNGQKESK